MSERQQSTIASKAQTASELAIFGAILVFVLGLMIRYAANFNIIQNQPLEAMRLAFKKSFETAEWVMSARSFASVLFVEDRKEVENTPYGASSRTPYIVSGSGSFSKSLYLTADCLETKACECFSLPIIDTIINGQNFIFRTAGFKRVRLPTGPFVLGPDRFPPYLISERDSPRDDNKRCRIVSVAGPDSWPFRPNTVEWDPDCHGPGQGCVTALIKIPNEDARFCIKDPSLGFPCSNMSADDRFDLDRDGTTDVIGDSARAAFAWQWYRIRLHPFDIDLQNGINVSVDVDGDLKEEQIVAMLDLQGNRYQPHIREPSDQELRDKILGQLLSSNPEKLNLAFVYVLDSQEGDLDFTYNTVDQNKYGLPAPGLQAEEQSVISFTKSPSGEGTKLVLQEGKQMYADGKQYAVQTQKQDRIDIVERRVQLSKDPAAVTNYNDTGFEVSCGDPSWYVAKRPVECASKGYVSCCKDTDNAYKTCLDRTCLVLYVRSKIQDLRGRRWVTDVKKGQE